MKTVIGQQGEVNIIKIDALPANMQTKPVERTSRGAIISHSESGHHHILEGSVEVLERTDNVPAGMQMLYAVLENPTELVQDAAGNPHKSISLDAGVYAFRISREFDPFMEQARRVAD